MQPFWTIDELSTLVNDIHTRVKILVYIWWYIYLDGIILFVLWITNITHLKHLFNRNFGFPYSDTNPVIGLCSIKSNACDCH